MKIAASIAATALLALAVPALAQTSTAPKSPDGKLSRADCTAAWDKLDTSKSGNVTEAQSKGVVTNFKSADTNNDSKLSQSEFMTACEKGLVNASAAVQLALQTATFATSANLVLRTAALDPAGLNQNLNQSLYRIYNVGSNALLAADQRGKVGSDWGFVTLGGFFDGDTTDMLSATPPAAHSRSITLPPTTTSSQVRPRWARSD